MHESWIVYRELPQAVLWKLSEDFQGNTFRHFCVRESEILLKKDSMTGVSYLGKYLKMDDFSQLEMFTFLVFSQQQYLSTVIIYNVTLNVN